MKLSPKQYAAVEGMCLDKPPVDLNETLGHVRGKLGVGRQGEVTILTLRRPLVPIDEWRRQHPFKTKRKLTDDEQRLIKAYVDNPSVADSALNAHMSVRAATRRWSEIYKALGVQSRPAALTASYLLGYWK